MISGIFAIYKDKGPTSFGVISELRKITGVRTIGHAGTLDPLASGVLVVAIGKEFTRKISEIVNAEKEYVADIKLGYESATDDEEGDKKQFTFDHKPTIDQIQNTTEKFVGRIMQTPPIYSAIKVGGKRAYKSARKGLVIEMKPREIEIKEIKILDYNWPNLKIDVTTGKGVYVRALARDIGRALGTGGYLADLERTRVGEFIKANSVTIEEFRRKFLRSKT